MDDRETIKEELTGICLFDVFEDSTLTEVQYHLAEIMGHLQSCTKGFRNFRFNVEDNGEIEVFIVADRDETDDEYNTRLEKKRKAEERRQKAIAKNEAAERALYESLRQKYGDKQ